MTLYLSKYFFQLDTSRVVDVRLHETQLHSLDQSTCARLINSCPLIQSLSIQHVAGFTDKCVVQVRSDLYRQLTKLTLHICLNSSFTKSAVYHIAQNCFNLKSVELSLLDAMENNALLAGLTQLLQNNQSIKDLNCFGVTVDADLMSAVTAHCHNLVTFTSLNSYDFSVRHVTDVILANPTLRKLTVTFEGEVALLFTVDEKTGAKTVKQSQWFLKMNDGGDFF